MLRTAIERAFGVVKARFRIMRVGCNHGYSEDFQAKVPVACMVTHNFIIRNTPSSIPAQFLAVGDAGDEEPQDVRPPRSYRDQKIEADHEQRQVALAMWEDYVAHNYHH